MDFIYPKVDDFIHLIKATGRGCLLYKFDFDFCCLNHLMHSKDSECIIMFLSAMPRDVTVTHIYVLKLPLHHL